MVGDDETALMKNALCGHYSTSNRSISALRGYKSTLERSRSLEQSVSAPMNPRKREICEDETEDGHKSSKEVLAGPFQRGS